MGSVENPDRDEEQLLMRRIQKGDTQALEILYDQYHRFLFGFILSMISKREEAEDLLQEVFTKIWNNASSYNPRKGSVYSWIVTLTRNKVIDRLRSKEFNITKKDLDHIPTLKDRDNNPLEDTVLSHRARLLQSALKELPDRQRRVIQIAYFRGLSQREIAEHLDIPLGTVKTRTRQGLLKLKDLLDKAFKK